MICRSRRVSNSLQKNAFSEHSVPHDNEQFGEQFSSWARVYAISGLWYWFLDAPSFPPPRIRSEETDGTRLLVLDWREHRKNTCKTYIPQKKNAMTSARAAQSRIWWEVQQSIVVFTRNNRFAGLPSQVSRAATTRPRSVAFIIRGRFTFNYL